MLTFSVYVLLENNTLKLGFQPTFTIRTSGNCLRTLRAVNIFIQPVEIITVVSPTASLPVSFFLPKPVTFAVLLAYDEGTNRHYSKREGHHTPKTGHKASSYGAVGFYIQ